MCRGSRTWCPVAVVAALVAVVPLMTGCHNGGRRSAPVAPPVARANSTPWDDRSGGSGVQPAVALMPAPRGGDPPDPAAEPMRRPRNILALSGGGAYGAYSAGFLNGWTKAGTRPELDVVTGISTGSLIAPFAFLGSDYDARLGQLYTRVQAADIFRIRAWVSIPFTDSVASSAPLRHLIETEISPALMERIAAEHRKGRRLYVGTTNLATRRLVIWDMGAIACRPCPEGCHLFRDILLASCSVPGMFPPVPFEFDVDGKKVRELHADGGVTAQLFVPSHVFAAAARGAAEDAAKASPPRPSSAIDPAPADGNLYVVVAGKLYPDQTPVKAKVLPVLGATTTAMLYAYCRADLSNLYGQARAAGLRYHLTALRGDFRTVEVAVDFDQKEMTKLFQEGIEQGTNGPGWMHGPPSINPGDGDTIRTGLKLKGPSPTGGPAAQP